MAKTDPIVERPRGASWRTSANAPDALRRQLYQQMLRDELGRDPDFRPAADCEENRVSGVVILLIVSVLAFMLVLAVWLWREGMFAGVSLAPQTTPPDKSWMLGDKQTSQPTEAARPEKPLESFVESPESEAVSEETPPQP